MVELLRAYLELVDAYYSAVVAGENSKTLSPTKAMAVMHQSLFVECARASTQGLMHLRHVSVPVH